MLVLSRKTGEKIKIGDDVMVTVLRVGPNNVRIGVDAPSHVGIMRYELTLPIPDDDTALIPASEDEL
jgi:carbon storage regulator